MKVHYNLNLLIGIALLLTLIPAPERVYAQWPPFSFSLTPLYEEGKITYNIKFRDRVNWVMTDVTFKIPLPEGTRFLEASAPPLTSVDFDGAEVTFFTPDLYRSIKTAFFVVEVTDPMMTVFTTHAWISWQGDQPGDYLTKDVSIDITKQPLNWEAPAESRLQLEASAMAADDVITYTIYPKNVGGLRMWDLRINAPIPEGTTFLSTEAPPSFITSFHGQEVSFSTVELEQWAEVGPLKFQVSVERVMAPFVVTHAWATWKNVGRKVGKSIVIQEETRSGDIIVQPHVSQWVVSDVMGDVPLSNYDITDIVLQDDGPSLRIMFHTAGDLGSAGEPLEYRFYIDSDCRQDTGKWIRYRGLDYRIWYSHRKGRATIYSWDDIEGKWRTIGSVKMNTPVGGKIVIMWVPYDLIENNRQFCWFGEALNVTQEFSSGLPHDEVGIDPRVAQHQGEATIAAGPLAGTFIDTGDTWQYLPGWSQPSPNWNTISFGDSNWFAGPTSIGYGDEDYATDLSLVTYPVQDDSMPILVQRTITQSGVILAVPPSGDWGSVFMRRAFTVNHPASLTKLTLEIEYEGGFVAYLNGVEVTRRGLGAPGSPVSYNTLATDNEAGTPEIIDLSDYITDLVTDTNMLAIQVHRSLGGSNLSITPRLTWSRYPWDASEPADITPPNDSNASAPMPPVTSLITDISGKLAVPLNNGWALYDVHIFFLPDGKEIAKIPNARQPNFRFDGQRMLINREGGGAENVYEYNFVDGTEKQVSDAPKDSHPFYDPLGTRVVYGNPELTSHDDGYRICVQCSLLPPHQETEPRCRDITKLGMLVSAGLRDEIWGYHPVWTANDMIAYRGCNSWAGFASCGIYIVSSTSTRGFSDGFIPRQLTHDTSDIPSDTKGNLIAFTSHREGNWEAYMMGLDDASVKNLSDSPNSDDGLPTISPDGNWVAFVSDRSGRWAVWAVPVAGGSAQKLFDLPGDNPWGDGDRTWTNERISWGP